METSLSGLKLGFLGCGNMAEAIIKGLLEKGLIPSSSIVASDVRKSRRDEVSQRFGIGVTGENSEVVGHADVVILAVKPQALSKVLGEVGARFRPDQLLLSLCAGVTTSRIEGYLTPGVPVVRSMPNIAAYVAQSATAICAGGAATGRHMDLSRALCEGFGMVEEVEESLMDAVTGLSGSGPAYIFLIIDALADAGVKVGLRRDQVRRLVAQTLVGSASLLLSSGGHPGELKDMVTSPGGTAIAGLAALEKGGLRTTLISAVETATQRSAELGRNNNGIALPRQDS